MALPPKLFADTSYFYACLDPGDENHLRAKTLAAEIASTPTSLLTTWDIVGETVTILRYRKNHHLAVRFLDEVKPQLRMVRYGDRIRKEAEQIFRRYGRDHRLSFCDAISFTVVKSLLGGMDCLSFDKDFRSLGLSVIN